MSHGPVSISVDGGRAGVDVESMSVGLGTAGSAARSRAWPDAALVAAAAAAVYANGFFGAFQFDDIPAILDNPTLRQLWPPWVPLAPPSGGMTVSGRPILNLSLALNYAVSGDRPWSYHALNLAIHIGAALVLLGLLRRTLVRLSLPDSQLTALAVALLWAVHPLTTEAVTYIVQRAESLMAFCYLLTLYAFIRSADSAEPARRTGWRALSVAACWLGMGVKEVMVSAPVAVLLYDRIFVAGTWRGAWRARRGYYLALAAAWLPLVGLVAGAGWDRSGTFAAGVSWGRYWLSQGEALARYAALSLWPHPLAVDYGPPTLPAGLAWLLAACVLAGVLATVVACLRGRLWAFLAGVCLMVLAPTSVVPATLQFASEHRMYLPLAGVLTGVVLGVRAAASRWSDRRSTRVLLAALAGVAAAGLGTATVLRNRVYRDDLALWMDTVVKQPRSAVAQANVGKCLLDRGRPAEALPYCEKAVALDPARPLARYNLGLAYEQEKRWTDALGEFTAAARLNPKLFYAEFRAGRLLGQLGHPAEGGQALRRAIAAAPDFAEAHGDLGVTLVAQGDRAGAVQEFERSLLLKPGQPGVEFNLGVCLSGLGKPEEAVTHFLQAIRIQPDFGEAQLDLGTSLAQLGRLAEALPPLETAARLMPESAMAHETLATALDQLGRSDEAIAEFKRALSLAPDHADAHYNYGNALIRARSWDAARAEFAGALRLRPDFTAAREMLNRLATTPPVP